MITKRWEIRLGGILIYIKEMWGRTMGHALYLQAYKAKSIRQMGAYVSHPPKKEGDIAYIRDDSYSLRCYVYFN